MRERLALACVVGAIGVFPVGGVALAAGFTGTSGPDGLTGTDRQDAIRGLDGDDRLMADDGKRDTIYCGSGTDYVYADRIDLVYYGCETIR